MYWECSSNKNYLSKYTYNNNISYVHIHASSQWNNYIYKKMVFYILFFYLLYLLEKTFESML